MPSAIRRARPLRDSEAADGFSDRPLRQTRILFVSFVQALFSVRAVNDYRWDDEEDKTEIVIRDENPIKVDTVGQRPAVNFTIGAVQFYTLGLDDMMMHDFRTGKKTKGVLVPGTMSINVSSRSDIEAHDLAFHIAEQIWLQRDGFMQKGFFDLGRNNQVTPPSPAGSVVSNDSGDEWYTSTVSVPLQFSRMGAVSPLNKEIMRRAELRFRLATSRPVESTGWPDTGHNGSVSVHTGFPSSYAPQASDARGRTPDPGGIAVEGPPLVPHPLNPAKTVVVRQAFPHRAGLRGPMLNGRQLPLLQQPVEESES